MQTEPLALTWTELNHSAARQYIDSRAVYSAWMEARGHLQAVELVISTSGCQASAKGDLCRDVLSKGKQAANLDDDRRVTSLAILRRIAFERLSSLERSLKIHQRLNRRHQVGLAPSVITRVLRALQEVTQGSPAYLRGPHALLGYAAAAGVHISGSQPYTNEQSPWLDLNLDLVLGQQLSHEDVKLALLRADPTFRYDAKGSVATNSTCFTVMIAQPVRTGPVSQPPGAKSSTDMSTGLREHDVRRVHLASDEGDMAEICVPDAEKLANDLLSRGKMSENSFENQRHISFAKTVQVLTKHYLQTGPEYGPH